LAVWPSREGRESTGHDEAKRNVAEISQPAAGRIANAVVRHPAMCTLCGLAVMLACGAPVGQMKTSVDIMRLFRSDAEILQDYDWLEQHLGYLIPVEVIVRYADRKDSLTLLQKMEFVGDVERNLRTVPSVGSSLSAVTFVPELSRGAGRRWLRRSVMNKQLVRHYDRLQESGYLVQSDGEELWRISLRAGPFRDLDYERLLHDLREQVGPLLQQAADQQSATIMFTGVMPVIYKARLSLLRDLLFGLATDLLLIFVAMVLLMRHWSSGVLLLLVSLFPATIVFGLLVWLGVVVEIGALMAPCVALGVTVDDVIHFLLWYRRGIQQGMDRPQAVLLAYAGCARAMCQSWAILGLGLSVMLLSSFVPNAQFGAAMVALLTAGLVGNLFFLPALLTGPLGGIIARQIHASAQKHAPSKH
jgi:predicted RND superfamily exporter protein